MNKIYANVTEDDLVDLPNFQWVVLASEAEEREAALRAKLDEWLAHHVKVSGENASLQQRLTVSEQFVQKLIDCTKNQDSIATGYLSDILDVIKGENVWLWGRVPSSPRRLITRYTWKLAVIN